MNPANEMECHSAVCSGTGVFYQAMPAIGADGRNIMKLIPVQKVNGQFVQSQMSYYRRDDAEPQRPITLNYASAPVQIRSMGTLDPSANGQFVKKPFSFTSGSPNQVGETGRGLDTASNLLTKIAQSVSSTPNCEKLVTLASQLPVTVKSPVLPNGQYLQIPPNARVRTISASDLPAAIKKQIFTSSANSNSSSPTVLYVSPVKTMNQCNTPPPPPSATPLHSLKILSKSSDQTSVGPSSVGSTSGSRSIAKESQRPNGPLKWVIEEEDGSLAPCLVPANFPIMTSEILKAVAERENANRPYENTTKKTPMPQSSPPKSGQGKDNALVMCNGKVYFVAKKCNLPFRLASENTGAVNSDEFSQTKSLPSRLSNVSVVSQASHTRQESSQIVIPDTSDEVIDLCDDDSQDDLLHQAGSQPDEDNVIFVSYIPPKSASTSGEHQREMAQVNKKAAEREVEKEVDQEIARSHSNMTGQKVVSIRENAWRPSTENCRNIGTAHPCKVSEEVYGTQERATGQEKELGQSKLISTDKSCASASGPQINRQKISNEHSATTKQMESTEASSINHEMENSLHDDNIPDKTRTHHYLMDLLSPYVAPKSLGSSSTEHSATTKQMESTEASSINQEMENSLRDDNIPDKTRTHPHLMDLLSPYVAPKSLGSSSTEHSTTTKQMESTEASSINQEMENSLHDDNISDKTFSHPYLMDLLSPCVAPISLGSSSHSLLVVPRSRLKTKGDRAFAVAAKLWNGLPLNISSGPEMGSIHSDSHGQKINNPHSATTQQMESMDAHPIDQEMDNSLHDDNSPDNTNRQSGPCIQMEGEMHTVKISTDPVSNQKSSQTCDHLLRKIFGITSDVKICLMRIDANKSEFVPEVPPQIASISNSISEDISELIQESKSGMKKRDHEESQGSQKRNSDSCPVDAKKLKLKTVKNASEDAADGVIAPSPQVDIGPLIKSNPQLETKLLISPSPQMESKSRMTQSPPKEALCDGEFEHMFGFEEPVEEDFTPTADENDIPNSQDKSALLKTETSGIVSSPGACCTDLNPMPRRRGRPRKCTVCPCGMTGTPVNKAKSSITKQKEPDLVKQKGSVKPESGKKKWEKISGMPSVTESSKTSKGQSGTAPREDKSAPVGIQCLSTKSERSCRTYGQIPTSNDLSATSMDSEEIKRHEQIKRLQDLLKEKEAALETMRKSMC